MISRMNETMAKASVGIMKMRPAVTTAERSPALASHASPHPKPPLERPAMAACELEVTSREKCSLF